MFSLWKKNKKYSTSFAQLPLPNSETSLELIYDHSLQDPLFESYLTKELRPKWETFSQKHHIEMVKGSLIIKGRTLPMKGEVIKIYLAGNNTLIVRDQDHFQDIHAFSLTGEHLWDIEGLRKFNGERAYSLGDPYCIKVNKEGRDLLLLHYFPLTFATDLLTGRGTYIFEIEDNTDMK